MSQHPQAEKTTPDQASELFVSDWQIYRKMVDNNFLFHREAYAALHDALPAAGGAAFDFLDIACGDAGASVGALRGTAVARYHGIDLSPTALGLAAAALEGLDRPFTLEEGEFAAALAVRKQDTDIAWIGLSLHHFEAPGKLAVMRDVRRILRDGGRLMVFENTSRDGEDRDGWLSRFDAQETEWTAYTPAEWRRMRDHVHGADFPETDATWRTLGAEAGFSSTRELYRTPTDLFASMRSRDAAQRSEVCG